MANKTQEFIYKEATTEANKVCEKLFPLIRQALMEAYAQGFTKASELAIKYNNKQQNS